MYAQCVCRQWGLSMAIADSRQRSVAFDRLSARLAVLNQTAGPGTTRARNRVYGTEIGPSRKSSEGLKRATVARSVEVQSIGSPGRLTMGHLVSAGLWWHLFHSHTLQCGSFVLGLRSRAPSPSAASSKLARRWPMIDSNEPSTGG